MVIGPIKKRSQASKREMEQLQKGAKTKKWKHEILSEDWGRKLITKADHHTTQLLPSPTQEHIVEELRRKVSSNTPHLYTSPLHQKSREFIL